jgi:hypothetical protein
MARIYRQSLPIKCFSFNGSSSSVTIPVTPSTTSFSIAFWFAKGRDIGSNNDRVIDWQVGGPADGFTVIQPTNSRNIAFQLNNVGSQPANISSGNLEIDRRYFIVCTFDSAGAGTANIFVDGVLAAQDTSVVMTTAATTFTIGKRATAASNFSKFKMGNFMFFNDKALTQSEVDGLYQRGTIPSGLTVHYDFENDVVDNSGNGNNGTESNSAYELFSSPVKLVTRGSTKALDFSGVPSANVSVADAASLRVETTEQFSWFNRVYIKKLDESVLPRIVEKGAHYSSWMGDKTNGRYRNIAVELADNGGAIEYWGNTKLEAGKWYDFAHTLGASGASINHYINGVAEQISTISGPLSPPMASTSGSAFLIGNSGGSNRNTGGMIKDVQQHNVLLTPSEVTQLFNGESVTRGLVGSWPTSEGSGATIADNSGNGFNGVMSGASWVNTNTRSLVASRNSVVSRTGV